MRAGETLPAAIGPIRAAARNPPGNLEAVLCVRKRSTGHHPGLEPVESGDSEVGCRSLAAVGRLALAGPDGGVYVGGKS